MRPQSLFAGILILGLMIIWEVEFFVLDIWPCIKETQAAIGATTPDYFVGDGTEDKGTISLIDINIIDEDSGTYYLKAYFYPKDNARARFGYIWNSTTNKWISTWRGNSEQLQINVQEDANWNGIPVKGFWSGQISVKTDIEKTGYQGPGSYNLKIRASSISDDHDIEFSKEDVSIIEPLSPQEDTSPAINYILINELLPDPADDDKTGEYVELFNNSDTATDISLWELRDESENKKEKPSGFIIERGTTILAFSYRAFYTGKKIFLNNDKNGDAVYLIKENQIIDKMTYLGPAPTSESYNRQDDGNWAWSATTTPGGQNKITSKTAISETPPTFPRHIWISEFLPNPAGKDTENEFIEIYNKGPNEIDLENWQIDDCEDKGSKPHPFPENKKIAGGEYLSLPYSETKIALNNDEDCVRLLWPNGAAIDEMEYGDPPEGESYNKINDRWCWSAGPTPGEQNNCSNESQEKKEYSRKIWINEILPNPEGKDENGEFIELQNRGDEEINLENWQIDDCEDKGSRPYTFPENTKIKAAGYLVLYYQDTKINLNNDGDCARLITPEGQAIDEITYGKSSEGQSYSRQNLNHWQWTIPSAGQDNNFPQVLESATAPLSPGKTNPESPVLPQTGPNLKFYIHASIAISVSRFTFKKWGVKIKAKLNLK